MTTLDVQAPPRDFLRVLDLSPEVLAAVLDLAATMKERKHGFVDRLRGDTVVCYFEQPSTRTRVSFAAAAERLGMAALLVRPDELQLGRGEPLADTARVLSGYASAIVVRAFAHSTVEEIAQAATVPVINALTDLHHPCQALADLLTLRERLGSLPGRKVAFVGAGNNVAHSLMEAGALAGMSVALATPSSHPPEPAIVAAAEQCAARTGGEVAVTDDPLVAVAGADAVYTDVWVSMGEDAEREDRLRSLAPYQVTETLMRSARSDAVFLHCLPAHRGEEVTAEVIDGPRSVVWQQAENRLPTEEAVLYALATGHWQLTWHGWTE
jgi:ornithine carbamoyltransferase